MRHRRHVPNAANVNARCCQSANRGFTSRAGARHANIDCSQTVIAGRVRRVLSCLLGRKGSSLTGSTEAQRTRALPAQRIAHGIGDGHNGVIERRLNVYQTKWNILPLTLFELLVNTLSKIGTDILDLFCNRFTISLCLKTSGVFCT